MRSFTFVVVAVGLLQLGTATAQDRPMRLSADIFVEASFPNDVIEAARKADEVALRTAEMRREIELRLRRVEKVYDDALLWPNISIDRLISVFENYSAVSSEYWSVDQNLKIADEVVESRYYIWTLKGFSPSSAQVFQMWREAARANYISVSSEEEETYRLMLNIGIDRINRQLQRQRRHKVPTLRRIND